MSSFIPYSRLRDFDLTSVSTLVTFETRAAYALRVSRSSELRKGKKHEPENVRCILNFKMAVLRLRGSD